MGLFQDIKESTDGSAFVNLQDSAGTGITSTLVTGKQGLDVNVIDPISGTFTSGVADETTYVYGATGSLFQPVGGVFQDTSPTLTAGQSGSVRLTSTRAFQINNRDNTGAEIGVVANPFFVTDPSAEASLTAINGKISPSSGGLSQLSLSTSSQTALASNASRKGFVMVNDSNKVAYIAFSATAASGAYTYKVQPNSTIEPNFGSYTGVISAIGAAGISGKLVITELV